jgi:hypothetical protein
MHPLLDKSRVVRVGLPKPFALLRAIWLLLDGLSTTSFR